MKRWLAPFFVSLVAVLSLASEALASMTIDPGVYEVPALLKRTPEGDVEAFLRPVKRIAPDTAAPEGMATVRVLPKGDGRIATGHFDRAANAFTYHSRGDHLIVENTVARAQEDAGLVEIVHGG